MNSKPKIKSSIKVVTSALAAGGLIVGGAGASTSDSAFALEELQTGYMVADSHGGDMKDGEDTKDGEGKCGEGKCGEGKCGEGKGAHMHDKDKKGKCKEGRCGEGKCGEDKKDGEGKCGEGKCGE